MAAERAGGDTTTPKSRRTLALSQKCFEALREHRLRQVKDRLSAGPLWKDNNLVFASAVLVSRATVRATRGGAWPTPQGGRRWPAARRKPIRSIACHSTNP